MKKENNKKEKTLPLTGVRKVERPDMEKNIMGKIKKGQVRMKPKWYFVFGTIFSVAGLTGLSVFSAFLINIILFVLRKHGPMAQWRFNTMLSGFPLWIPVIAVAGMYTGIRFLKKYDFSYKKNFIAVTVGFIIAIFTAGYLIDKMGINQVLSRKGPMRRFYQSIDSSSVSQPVERKYPKFESECKGKCGSSNNLNSSGSGKGKFIGF